jgi:hypothetical protein
MSKNTKELMQSVYAMKTSGTPAAVLAKLVLDIKRVSWILDTCLPIKVD